MLNFIKKLDTRVVGFMKVAEVPLARIALFVVYFWFGFLKLVGLSPAAPLVEALFKSTIPFIPFPIFYTLFSLFEVAIGILFLIRGFERLALALLGLHLITTMLPLIVLPQITWQAFLIPTLEGQYIIKNILIVASAVVVGSTLTPASSLHRQKR